MWLVAVDVLVSFLVGLGCSVVCCVDFLLWHCSGFGLLDFRGFGWVCGVVLCCVSSTLVGVC